MKHFVLELSRWLDLLDHGSMNLTWCEAMGELLLLLRISAVFVKDNDHLSSILIIGIDGAFTAHLYNLSNLVF